MTKKSCNDLHDIHTWNIELKELDNEKSLVQNSYFFEMILSKALPFHLTCQFFKRIDNRNFRKIWIGNWKKTCSKWSQLLKKRDWIYKLFRFEIFAQAAFNATALFWQNTDCALFLRANFSKSKKWSLIYSLTQLQGSDHIKNCSVLPFEYLKASFIEKTHT